MPESDSFTVPGPRPRCKLKEHLVVYNPHIHSQFSGSGRLLISYNINRSHNADTIYIDGYRPRFIYVPIAGLNSSSNEVCSFQKSLAQIVRTQTIRIGAMIDDDTIADLTPSVLPLGLTADEVLRCYDLATIS